MERPDIILITTDQQRFDGLALNGNDVLRTPNLDHWAASGTNFSRAYTTCPSCIAARRTILTGLHPSNPLHGLPGYQDGVEFNPPWTLPGQLKQVGYQTQLIGKFHVYPQRKRFGFDNVILSETMDVRPGSPWFGQNDYWHWLLDNGQDQFVLPNSHGLGPNEWGARPWQLDENLHHTSWLVEEAFEFIRTRRDPSCPYFLHLSFWAPHPPLVPPQVYWDRYVGREDWAPHVGGWVPQFPPRGRPGVRSDSPVGPFNQEWLRETMAGYYGLINHLDDRLQHLVKQTTERATPRAGRPLAIVFTSDHGEMLGDHQLYRKTLAYEGSAHVPFFIHTRNMERFARAGAASDALVSLEDILPTVCDLAGAPTPDGVDGRSLLPVLRGQADRVRDELFGEHSGAHASHFIVSGRHKYVWYAGTNEEQIFDLADDPWEQRDLSADAALLTPMRARMAEHLNGRTDYAYDPAALKPLANRQPSVFWTDSDREYLPG
ncbi:MAG: Arylsulfatase [Phycisphaerae bacterium]|nr:Arylsulfatase [Phycisphaerae bacterium]